MRVLLGLCWVLLMVGCGSDTSPAPSCPAPGAEYACDCGGGTEGRVTCDAQRRPGPCVCFDAGEPDAPTADAP